MSFLKVISNKLIQIQYKVATFLGPWLGVVIALISIGLLFKPVIPLDFKVSSVKLTNVWEVTFLDPIKCKDNCIWYELSKLDSDALNKYRGYLGYRMKVESSKIPNVKQLALFLGPVGDIDETYWNGSLIGKTGAFFPEGRFAHHKNRIYDVPKALILNQNFQTILLKVQKVAGPGVGPYRYDPYLGESTDLQVQTKIRDFISITGIWVGAIVLIILGIYHFILFQKLPARRDYFYTGMSLVFTGIYGVCASFTPYIHTPRPGALFRIHAISGYFAIAFLIAFIREHFSLKDKLMKWANIIITSVCTAASLMIVDFDRGILVLQAWFGFFVIFCVWTPWIFWKHRKLEQAVTHKVLRIGLFIFCATIIHDMMVTSGLFRGNLISIYGMFAFLGGIAVMLAQEFALRYAHVEEQVESRTKDLAIAIERLKDLEEMKDKFFANISHDFKTPIAVAMGSLEEIKRETLPTEAVQRRAVIAAESSLNKLLTMVGDLLDVIKAESGTLKMEWVSVNPVEILKEWMQPFLVLASKKSLRLNIKNDVKGDIKIPLDVNKFERVIQNLLSNALKFTNYTKNKENLIEMQLRSDKAWYYIEVHDSGMGIPDDEKPMVFERYYQTTKTSLKHHGGSGIGLSFVKEMIENHNGTITVKDSDYGGVKFVIALPLKQNVEVTGNYFVGSDGEENDEIYSVEFPRRAPERINESLFTILVAEDNPEVANITLAAVEKEFNVYMVENGQEAFDFIQNNTIDCLVTDIVMPVMRGEELVKKVRAYNKTKDLPIVVLSSQSDENTVVELLKEGANDYVTKPFKREVLLARVYGQIEKHKSSQWIAQNEKVIELGMLASGIAHQIRNGLHAMKNQISYYEKTAQRIEQNIHELSEEQRHKIKDRLDQCNGMMMRALNRIDSLTSSVNSYALGSKQVIEITMKDSLTLMQELLADKIKSSAVTLELDIQDNLKFFGYSSFHEVIINLFVNAIDACQHDGTGKITLKAKESREKIKIEIEDNGSGINKDALDRIWQPFFTTKDPDKGTGLGLYIVRDIIQGQHGGKLNVYSDGDGKGAKFIIEIPKVAKEATQDASFVMHGHEV